MLGKRLALRAYNVVVKQTIKSIKKAQGGFSDIRLWPCYSVVGALALFLSLRVGMFLTAILIYMAVILATSWTIKRAPTIETDYKAWGRDVEHAITNGLEIPDFSNYEYVVNKKVKAAKQPRQKSPQFKLANAKALNT